MVALPLWPSLVAVIVAVPAATAVTSPVAETVATDDAFVLHVTVRPVSVLPFASVNVVVSVVVPPTVSVALPGLTATVATGARVTVTVAEPDAAPLVAVIVAVPGATPVTTPDAETLATLLAF